MPSQYSKLFIFALIPGAIAFMVTFYLSRERKEDLPPKKTHTIASFKDFWKKSPIAYKKLIFGFLLFALINSSNAFLLLRAKELQYTEQF